MRVRRNAFLLFSYRVISLFLSFQVLRSIRFSPAEFNNSPVKGLSWLLFFDRSQQVFVTGEEGVHKMLRVRVCAAHCPKFS